MKRLFGLAAAVLISGCGSNLTASKVEWITVKNTDKFTDKSTCAVTVGSFYSQGSVYTASNHYYPYIEAVDGNLRVGVRSGGRFLIPVGDVQIRIDQNPAWTISTGETPLDYVPEGQLKAMQAAAPQDPNQQQIVANAYKTAMESTARAMSPFTAATGDKARSILSQMRSGHSMIYRTVGLNQAASTTGEYALDQSLETALRQCGIK